MSNCRRELFDHLDYRNSGVRVCRYHRPRFTGRTLSVRGGEVSGVLTEGVELEYGQWEIAG